MRRVSTPEAREPDTGKSRRIFVQHRRLPAEFIRVRMTTTGLMLRRVPARREVGRPRHEDHILKAARLGEAHSFPITSPRNPYTVRAPESGTSATSRVEPGSKRTAVPGAMSRR